MINDNKIQKESYNANNEKLINDQLANFEKIINNYDIKIKNIENNMKNVSKKQTPPLLQTQPEIDLFKSL